ncbi:MAG: hypothetical protein IJP52_01980 [Paludibacteraceae bacterium]|nr:hypothetical protein [Paludibacteraceae bacterium]
MKAILYNARQIVYWLSVLVLFRILLHIPDADNELPIDSLAILSVGIDILEYVTLMIYMGFILAVPPTSAAVKRCLWGGQIAIGGIVLLHFVLLKLQGTDPDLYWHNGSELFKIIYLMAYSILTLWFVWLSLIVPNGRARYAAWAVALFPIPFFLFIILFINPFFPQMQDNFVLMVMKDFGMDIALIWLLWEIGRLTSSDTDNA